MIGIEKFGKDHWSTFGYIETRIVDHGGRPAKYHMRCGFHHPLHRHLIDEAPSTRLRDKETQAGHDDWDCLDDLEEAGLLTSSGTGMFPVYALTTEGERVAAELRSFKAKGGNFSDFVPSPKESA